MTKKCMLFYHHNVLSLLPSLIFGKKLSIMLSNDYNHF